MKILYLEDNRQDVELVRSLLQGKWADCQMTVVDSRQNFLTELVGKRHELILSDFKVPGFGGMEALQLSREHAPEIPFIFLSGTIGEDRAIEAVQGGASDYVLKDRLNRLVPVIQRVLDENRERQARMLAEQARDRLIAILDHTPDFVSMVRPDGTSIYLNRGGRRLIGLGDSESLENFPLTKFHPPQVAERLLREVIPAAARDGIWSGEMPLQTLDHRLIPTSQVIIAHRDASRALSHVSIIARDITEREESERRLREQAELINKARDSIIVTDLEDHVTFWNAGAERLSGWTAAEVLGRTIAQVFGESTAAQFVSARQTVSSLGEWQGEISTVNKTKQTLIIETRISLISDESGRPKARLSISTDITEKKKLQEQFFRAQRLEGIGMLAAGIAHDLNNVLTPILMAGPMLRVRATDPLDKRLLETLEHSAERGAALVRQILAFAHGSTGEPRLLQVKHLARDIIEIIEETFPKSIKLEQYFPAEVWPIRANPTQIHQVLLNLCVNARDAMPHGGTLQLTTSNRRLNPHEATAIPYARPGDFVVIEVKDSGSGIAPEILERIWEPFFTTKQAGKGTGLGLSTVRGIVEASHGFIELKSKVGRGSTFKIYLPAAETGITAGADAAPQSLPRGDGQLLLLVDDEVTNREVVHATLARFGYRVLSAANGTEAMALFIPRAHEIRLVITDLNMPNIDGASLVRILRRMKPDLKVLAISGLSAKPGSETDEPEDFADAYLGKPFRAEALLMKVSQLIVAEPAT